LVASFTPGRLCPTVELKGYRRKKGKSFEKPLRSC